MIKSVKNNITLEELEEMDFNINDEITEEELAFGEELRLFLESLIEPSNLN